MAPVWPPARSAGDRVRRVWSTAVCEVCNDSAKCAGSVVEIPVSATERQRAKLGRKAKVRRDPRRTIRSCGGPEALRIIIETMRDGRGGALPGAVWDIGRGTAGHTAESRYDTITCVTVGCQTPKSMPESPYPPLSNPKPADCEYMSASLDCQVANETTDETRKRGVSLQ